MSKLRALSRKVDVLPEASLNYDGKIQYRLRDHGALDSTEVIVHLCGEEGNKTLRRVGVRCVPSKKVRHEVPCVQAARLQADLRDRFCHRGDELGRRPGERILPEALQLGRRGPILQKDELPAAVRNDDRGLKTI
jgi:hypothetical protein